MPVIVVQLCQFALQIQFLSLNVYGWVETIAFFNSTLNPMICCWRNSDIRQGMLRMLKRIDCTRKRQRSRSTVYFLPSKPQAAGDNRADEKEQEDR